MRNSALALDYVRRAGIRLDALQVLFDRESWPDVVGEAQEIVELALKGLLRAHGIEAPRTHDVSEVLLSESDRLPDALREELASLAEISRDLRRDRELAFYGAEDLVPSGFYSLEDARRAFEGAHKTVRAVEPHVG